MNTFQQAPIKQDARDWLCSIHQRGTDLRWLAPHEEQLAILIQRGIYTPPEFPDTLELLMEIVPYFVSVRFHIEKWSCLMMDALMQADDLKNSPLQAQLLQALGEANLQAGLHQPSEAMLMSALERANEAHFYRLLVNTYIGLLNLQWFDMKRPGAPAFVHHALEAASYATDAQLTARLYEALARAYVRLGQTEIALGYGQMAYSHWTSQTDPVALGRAAFTLATIYSDIAVHRELPACLDRAEVFLEIAEERIAPSEYAWQYTLLAYGYGVLCLQKGHGGQAEEWFQIALNEALTLGINHYIAIAYHGLGLAQTQLNFYPASRNSLRQALAIWEELKNEYEQASTMQALGYLEWLDGQANEGLKYCYRAYRMCQALAESPRRDNLLIHIQQTIDEIKKSKSDAGLGA